MQVFVATSWKVPTTKFIEKVNLQNELKSIYFIWKAGLKNILLWSIIFIFKYIYIHIYTILQIWKKTVFLIF